MQSQPQQVRALFDQALDRPRAERAAFLGEACGADATLRQAIERLLADHERVEAALPETVPTGECAGDRIGPYELIEKIGEGGFGVVWLAEQQQPLRRRVALKILKLGLDTHRVVARFEAERQTLALMDHPNIARVFDAGATATGRPYFAMELVRGVPITRYCDEAKLTPHQRIELFVPVCEAVQHAHQKGVIHRDLKPGNVLVTLVDGRPVPKVIDFGIAKATAAEPGERTAATGFRQMLGTPEYMAPEQAEPAGLDVDTRADVYSLGVLLYELLTGTRPFELEELMAAGYAEMLRTIQEVDPPKPSTRVSTLGEGVAAAASRRQLQPRALCAFIRGDLDWIVMKALRKERDHRYPSAAALAEDVQRHLRHEPVLAGPPGRGYRLRKYLRRNRLAVAAAAAVALATFVGAVASGLGYLEAKEQARLAEQAAATARTERAAAIAARAEEARQKAAALDAKNAADAQRQAAETHAKEARTEAAKAQQVVELLRRMLASSNPYENKDKDYKVRQLLDDFARGLGAKLDVDPALDPAVELTLRQVMGQSYQQLGLPKAAEPHLVRAAELAKATSGAASLACAEREIELAGCWREAGRFDAALALLAEVAERLAGDTPGEKALHAVCQTARASTLSSRRQPGDLEQAENLAQQAIAWQREHQSPHLAASLSCLGIVYQWQLRLEAAQAVQEELLALDIGRYGEDSLEVATDKCNLAGLIEQRGGDLARAEALHREALAVRRHRLGEHLEVAHSLNNLAALYWARRDVEAAIATSTEARDLLRRMLGEHVRVALYQQTLAMMLQGLGRFEEAKRLQQEAVAMRRRLQGDGHPDLANALSCLGEVLASLDDRAAAGAAYDEAIAMFRRLGAESDLRYAGVLVAAAQNLLPQRRPAEAEPLARDAVDRLRRRPDIEPPQLVKALRALGLSLLDQGKPAEAEVPLSESLELARGLKSRDAQPAIVQGLESLGELQEAKLDLAAAEASFREAIERCLAFAANEPTPALQEQARARAARTQEYLARVLAKQGNHQAAMDAYQRLLRVQRRQGNRQAVASTLSALAGVLDLMQMHAEAEAASREALDVLQELHGTKHGNVAAALNNLAEVLSNAGKLAEAEGLYRRGLELLSALGQGDSVAAATQLTNLGRVLLAENRLDEAATTCERALAVFAHAGAADHAHAATCLDHLGTIAERKGDRAASLSCFRRALALRRGHLAPRHAEIAARLDHLAGLLLRDRQPTDAEPLARECLEIRVATGAGTWLHHSAQALLGRALAGQDAPEKRAEAERLLVEACTKMAPPPGGTADLKAALQALITLYEASGRGDKAAVWQRKLAALGGESGR